ncbi:hypothetical protein BH10BAC1_BH10BAC1_13460 [soil metagenome]
MRIVILCGNQSNQHALALKVSKQFEVVGIVLESKETRKTITFQLLISKVMDRLFFRAIASSWKAMLSYYESDSKEINKINSIRTKNINSKETLEFIIQLQPDLIMVSGTSLIKKDVLNLKLSKGIINLHTGLSPYVKGGPNCTNWCISNNTMHLVGNTIMWLDKGIDSGNIITSKIVLLSGNETLNQLHIKVMEEAHMLYLEAVECIKKNHLNCPSVKQSDISEGTLYLTKMWNSKAKWNFILNVIMRNHKKNIQKNTYSKLIDQVTVVKLFP